MQKIEYVRLGAISILFTLMLSLVYIQFAAAEMGDVSSDVISPVFPHTTMQLVSGEEPKIVPIIVIIGIGR